MTKRFFIHFCLLLALGTTTVVFNSCGKDEASEQKNSEEQGGSDSNNITVKGIVINGVEWATCNIATPGTFVDKPENFGMFYQWNRKIGWSSIDPLINSDGETYWDSSISEGSTWTSANDPSPTGWRVPNLDDIRKLLDTDKVDNEWATVNGVNGKKFTDKISGNSIFLPAAGSRYSYTSALYNTDTDGHYWSSTSDVANAYLMTFCNDCAYWHNGSNNRGNGHSIRPVVK